MQSGIEHLGAPAGADYMVAMGIDRKISYGSVELRLKGSNEGASLKDRRVSINGE